MPGMSPDIVTIIEIVADLGIAMLCMAIAGSILWLTTERRDLPQRYRRAAWLTMVFLTLIAACFVALALGHGQGVMTFIRVLAVIAGAISAAMLVPLVPQLLALPSPVRLQSANALLVSEIEARRRALDELKRARDELEIRAEERARAVIESSRRLDLALRGTQVTVFNQDRDLRYTWMSQEVLGRPADWFIGKSDVEIFEGATRDKLVASKQSVLTTGEPTAFEIMVPPSGDGDPVWFNVQLEPIRESNGAGAEPKRQVATEQVATGENVSTPEIVGIIGIAVDISDQKRREQHIRLLMRELAHRSKNALAVVQAIARQTATHTGSKEAFLASFSARVDALASSSNLLVEEGWRGADLGGLIRSQLGHYVGQVGTQILLNGPPVALPASIVQNVGLAFHELATNAAKYGALSNAEGRVLIDWRVEHEAGERRLTISWQETGGPPVAKPARKGFGQVVIERTVARAVGGDVVLDYAPEGLQWTLSFPLASGETHASKPGAANAA